MGIFKKIIEDRLISPIPDRNSNRIYIYRKPNNEVSIWFRNLKITLLSEEEIQEWKEGFKIALENFKKGNYFQNDI
jgi:hypothetical protein